MSPFFARCFKNYYGLLGERCVECWRYFRTSKYSRTIEGGQQKVFVSECTGEFQSNVGAAEPTANAGFSLLPPHECFSGNCLFDNFPLQRKASWIPEECVPIPVQKIGPGEDPVLTTTIEHNFENDETIQLVYSTRATSNRSHIYGEQSMLYVVKVMSPTSIRLRLQETDKTPSLSHLMSVETLYLRLLTCEDALQPGEVCHPARYNGTISRNRGITGWYQNKGFRKACPFLMPCEPPLSCGPNSTCTPGYMDYYEPYMIIDGQKKCNSLHYTIKPSICYAPRCSMCDISPENPHFRLDGLCVPCPAIPWLLPAMMGFGALCALIGMLVLSRSKVSRHVLRIGVDYFQVLAMFRTAKVSWPIEIEFMLRYVQFFQMDIDLTGPECAFRGLVTYENKFFFKVALPFLGGGVLAAFFFLLSSFNCILRSVRKRRAKSATNQSKEVSPLARVTSLTMSLAYFLYLTVCRAGFDILNCQDTIPPTGRLYMVAMPLEECYVPGGLQLRLLPYAIAVLIFYGVGFPLGIVLFFIIKKKAILDDQALKVQDKGNDHASNPNYNFRRACGQMYSMFQPHYHMWAIFMLMRKLLLCAVSVLFKDNPSYQLSATLALMFAAFILQVKAKPYLDVREKAKLMRMQAEKSILAEVLRLERQSLLVRVQGQSYSQLMHTMRVQIDEQDKIMQKHKNDVFNLNSVELVLLTCAVTICLSGIMYDSPFLSDGSYPLRGVILAYSSIAVIVFSIVYFSMAFAWEIKSSKQKKKTKRQVMWSKLKGMKHVAVEDYRKQQKTEKLSSLMAVTRKPMKFDLQKLRNISDPMEGKKTEVRQAQVVFPTAKSPVLSEGTNSSSSRNESLMEIGSDTSSAFLSDSTASSAVIQESIESTESSERHSSGTLSSTDHESESSHPGSEISYESETSRSGTSEDFSESVGSGDSGHSDSTGSIMEVGSSHQDSTADSSMEFSSEK